MSESMSSPWIRDYIVGIAETHGAQLYNVPMSKGKKRVQLTDFLTYQEDSYVWAWVSDKDCRISARISKDAIDEYKRKYSRSIVDSRFFLVFISSYRPMFSRRPLGPNVLGNTNVSHISLEIDQVSFIGMGWHAFGNPRELESDEKLKEWVLGLRQDGGGGNVLKLRKQQELAQNKKAPPSPPSSPPFSVYAPVSQYQNIKDTELTTNSNPEKTKDFKRAYSKRWRKIEIDPWKFATKPPAEQQPIPTESGHPPAEPPLDSLSTCDHGPLVCPASRHRMASPTPLHQQGTPTDWSFSNRGSPVALEKVKNTVSGTAIQQHDEPDALPTTPHLTSDTEWHATVDAAIASDTHSPQPPTPAQRIRRSLPPRTSPPPNMASEMSARSPLVSSQLPGSSPFPPSSSLPIPSSSLPIPMGIRKNIQRKVPHPGLPTQRPDSSSQGPAQVLVPNSETSGTGSSQSFSQSQHRPSQSSHPSASLPHISKELNPGDESASRERKSSNSTRRVSKMLAESLRTHDNERVTIVVAGDKHSTEADVNAGELEGQNPTRSPGRGAPNTKVLEVGTSDTEEEADVLQLTHTAWMETRLAVVSKQKDPGEGNANADHENSQLSIDDADIHLTLQGNQPHRSPPLATASVALRPSPAKESANVPIHSPAHSSEWSGSQNSMHSLFSGSLDDERTTSSQALVSTVGRNEDEKASPADGPRHDSEAWKEPSFIAKHKGKNKAHAVEGPGTPSVTVNKRRRQRSSLVESPLPKRAKSSPTCQELPDQATTRNQDREESEFEKTHSKNWLATSPKGITETTTPPQLPKPRLANFVVDFTRIDLGKKGAIPRLDLYRDIKATLLRTGRIRTLGENVEKDGSVYIHS